MSPGTSLAAQRRAPGNLDCAGRYPGRRLSSVPKSAWRALTVWADDLAQDAPILFKDLEALTAQVP